MIYLDGSVGRRGPYRRLFLPLRIDAPLQESRMP